MTSPSDCGRTLLTASGSRAYRSRRRWASSRCGSVGCRAARRLARRSCVAAEGLLRLGLVPKPRRRPERAREPCSSRGFVGVQVPATDVGTPAGWERLAPVLDVVERAGTPLLVHPGPEAADRDSAALPSWWPAVVGYAAQMQAAWWGWHAAGCGPTTRRFGSSSAPRRVGARAPRAVHARGGTTRASTRSSTSTPRLRTTRTRRVRAGARDRRARARQRSALRSADSLPSRWARPLHARSACTTRGGCWTCPSRAGGGADVAASELMVELTTVSMESLPGRDLEPDELRSWSRRLAGDPDGGRTWSASTTTSASTPLFTGTPTSTSGSSAGRRSTTPVGTTTTSPPARSRWLPASWSRTTCGVGSPSLERRVVPGRRSPSSGTAFTASTVPSAAPSPCTPTARRCGGWASTPSAMMGCCAASRVVRRRTAPDRLNTPDSSAVCCDFLRSAAQTNRFTSRSRPALEGADHPSGDPAAVEAAGLRSHQLAVDGAFVYERRHHGEVVEDPLEAGGGGRVRPRCARRRPGRGDQVEVRRLALPLAERGSGAGRSTPGENAFLGGSRWAGGWSPERGTPRWCARRPARRGGPRPSRRSARHSGDAGSPTRIPGRGPAGNALSRCH